MSGYQIVTTDVPPGGAFLGGDANCPAGKVVTGGGVTVGGLINSGGTADGTGPHVWKSAPSGQSSWSAAVGASQSYAGSFGITVYAICVNAA